MSLSIGAMAAIAGASALAQGVGNIGGSAFNWGVNSWLNQQQQKMALDRMASEQQFNALEAQKARDWQEYMASTSYQRAIADMEKAGLNPASLVGSSPSGAMAPSSASASAGASGVAGSRMTTEGLAYDYPVASNDTEAGRAQNRRVEIYITANEEMVKAAQEGTLN